MTDYVVFFRDGGSDRPCVVPAQAGGVNATRPPSLRVNPATNPQPPTERAND